MVDMMMTRSILFEAEIGFPGEMRPGVSIQALQIRQRTPSIGKQPTERSTLFILRKVAAQSADCYANRETGYASFPDKCARR